MNQRQAKRYVWGALSASLQGDIDSGAGYLFTDSELTEADVERVVKAAREIVAIADRKAKENERGE